MYIKFYTTLILLILTYISNALPYQTIYPDRVAYYSGYVIYPLYVEGTENKNDDICLYTNDVIEGWNESPLWLKKSPMLTRDKVIVHSDGTNIYFNQNGDSIIIKTQAKENEKWICFQPADSSMLLEAEVIKIEKATTLGQPDSIKTIRFKVLQTKNWTSDDINSTTVIISQNYGWVKLLNFKTFPDYWFGPFYVYSEYITLVGINNPNLGIKNLTTFDIFDFQPGDIIHIKDTYYSPTYPKNIKSIRYIKQYLKRSDYPDSIVYNLRQKTINCIDESVMDIKIDTVTETIKRNPDLEKLPLEEGYYDDSSYISLVWMSTIDRCTINGNLTKIIARRLIKQGNEYSAYVDIPEFYYHKGLGGPYYSSEMAELIDHHLVYYQKGNITWGKSLDITTSSTLTAGNDIEVFPTLSSGIINISSNSKNLPLHIELIDISGQIRVTKIINDPKLQIDLHDLPGGNYLYRITSGKLILKTGKICILSVK